MNDSVLMPATIERYRSAILAAGGLLTAVLLQLGEALVPGRPLGGIEFANLAFSAIVLGAVYFPANPWAKLASGVAGAVGQTVISAITDDRITPAEIVTISVALLVALGIGTLPNKPTPDPATGPVAPTGPPETGTTGSTDSVF